MLPPRQTSPLTSLDAHRRAEKPGRSPLARETAGTGAQAPGQRVGLLNALPRPTGLGPRPPPVPGPAGPGRVGPGGPFRAVPGGRGGGGSESAAEAAAVAGGRPAPCGRRRGPAGRVFSSAKCLRQKLRRPLRTRLPGPSCPFPDTQKSARSPDNVPARLPTGPIPLRLPSHLPGSSGGAAFFFYYYYFLPLPPSPPPVITFTAGPLLFDLFIPPSSPGGTGAEKRPTGGKKANQDPPNRPQLGRSAGAPRPPPPSTRDFRAAVPPHTHTHTSTTVTPRGIPVPADKGRTRVKIMEGSGKEKAAGLAGGGRWQVRRRVPPGSAALFSAAPATPGARRSAEEITVRSITCQTLNWIGYFCPPLPFVTDSVHITNSESPIGIIGIEPFCKSC